MSVAAPIQGGGLAVFLRFLVEEEPWRAQAACRGMGSEPFFPVRGESQKEAKAVCARCPVQAECEAYAQRTNSTYGIWAGRIRHRGPQRDKDE